MASNNFTIKFNHKLNTAERLFVDNVFMPVVGIKGLDFLMPQTPFIDSEGRNRRIDFTIESRFRKYAIEVDGYTYHAEGVVPRDRFDDGLLRQNDLMIAGYTVLRFSYDQITRVPEQCQAQLRRAFVADEELNPLFSLTTIAPNNAQRQALQALENCRRNGNRKGLVVLATGLGKTYLAAFDARRFCESSGGKVLFLVHNTEILKQSADKFANVWVNATRGLYYGQEKVIDSQVMFASMQSMANVHHRMNFAPTHFEYIIIDESHRTAANSYREILSYFTPKFLLGITATPDRLDEQEILPFYENNLVFEMGQRQAIEAGYLVPFKYYGLKDNVDYSNIRYSGYRYNVLDLDKLLMIDKRDEAVIREFKERVPAKRGIGFCVSIKHAERCAEKFNSAGIPSVAIHSQLDKEVRDEYVRKFRKGLIQLAFVRDIFNEGVDFPEVEVLLFLRPTESKTIFVQQLGRGLRLSPRKEFVTVLDFIGNYKKANRVRNYLQALQSTDKQQFDREGKPEYHYPLGSEVFFDEEVLEIFSQQEAQKKEVTREELLDAYIKLKDVLGHQPTVTEMNKYGDYRQVHYIKLFGSWNNFLESIGEVSNLTPEILTRAYFEVKEKLGHPPSKKEMEEHCSFSTANYYRFWGGWKQFLISINEADGISQESLTEAYFELKKKLGRIPRRKEINEHYNFSAANYSRFWGSWNDFLRAIGEVSIDENHQLKKKIRKEALRKRRQLGKPSRQELIDEFLRCEKVLGKQPTNQTIEEVSKYPSSYYREEFGSWSDLLKHLNRALFRPKATDSELIENYRVVKEKLGRTPSVTEIREHGKFAINTYRNRWGGWTQFLEAIGETSKRPRRNASKEIIKQDYFRVKESLGRVPTAQEIRQFGKFSLQYHYGRKFGGYRAFLKEIGETSPTEDLLISAYINVKEKLGRQPTAHEFTKYSSTAWNTAAKHFGSWNDFLLAMGETTNIVRNEHRSKDRRRISKQDLVDAYYRLKEKIGRQPTLKDVIAYGEYSNVAYARHFGSWLKFLESINEPTKYYTLSNDDLIAAYYELKEKLGHIPTSIEMKKHGKYSDAVYFKRFGGWIKFLKLLGET